MVKLFGWSQFMASEGSRISARSHVTATLQDVQCTNKIRTKSHFLTHSIALTHYQWWQLRLCSYCVKLFYYTLFAACLWAAADDDRCDACDAASARARWSQGVYHWLVVVGFRLDDLLRRALSPVRRPDGLQKELWDNLWIFIMHDVRSRISSSVTPADCVEFVLSQGTAFTHRNIPIVITSHYMGGWTTRFVLLL